MSRFYKGSKSEFGREDCNGKQIAQYDLSGKLMKIYPSITKAAQAHGLFAENVQDAAKPGGRQASSGGFMWRHFSIAPDNRIEPHPNPEHHRVKVTN